jgi:hypothetical protein
MSSQMSLQIREETEVRCSEVWDVLWVVQDSETKAVNLRSFRALVRDLGTVVLAAFKMHSSNTCLEFLQRSSAALRVNGGAIRHEFRIYYTVNIL